MFSRTGLALALLLTALLAPLGARAEGVVSSRIGLAAAAAPAPEHLARTPAGLDLLREIESTTPTRDRDLSGVGPACARRHAGANVLVAGAPVTRLDPPYLSARVLPYFPTGPPTPRQPVHRNR